MPWSSLPPPFFLGAFMFATVVSAPAFAAVCQSPEIGTDRAPMVSPPLEAVVIGTGRLQFYSAPDARCPISGTFVIPRDKLVVYSTTSDGWSSVIYFGSKSTVDVSGWVRTARLKMLGAMGPSR